MEYTLNIRSFLNIKRKEKAVAHAERLFPGLPVQIVGPYYKDRSLWECVVKHDCEYLDDKTALWETLTYFSAVQSKWLLLVFPNSDYDTVVSATAENRDKTGMTWCHFELLRRNATNFTASNMTWRLLPGRSKTIRILTTFKETAFPKAVDW